MFVVSTCWVSVLRELFHEKCLEHRIVWNLPKAFLKVEPSGPVVLTLCMMLCVPPEHGTWWGRGESSSLALSTTPAPTLAPRSAQPSLHPGRPLPNMHRCVPRPWWFSLFPCFNSAMGLPRLDCRHIISLQVFISLWSPTLVSFIPKSVRIVAASLSLLVDHMENSRFCFLIYCAGGGLGLWCLRYCNSVERIPCPVLRGCWLEGVSLEESVSNNCALSTWGHCAFSTSVLKMRSRTRSFSCTWEFCRPINAQMSTKTFWIRSSGGGGQQCAFLQALQEMLLKNQEYLLWASNHPFVGWNYRWPGKSLLDVYSIPSSGKRLYRMLLKLPWWQVSHDRTC